MKTSKKIQSLYIETDLLNILQLSAKENGRSLSAEICYILRKNIAK